MTEFAVTAAGPDVDVIRPEGRLNMVSARQLTETVGQLVERGRVRIIVDLAGTQFMDSSGLGALVTCLKKARQAGGDLRIAAPTAQVRTVLDLTNISRVLAPAETVGQAAAAF